MKSLPHERPYAHELTGAHSTGPVTGGADWAMPEHWLFAGTGMKKGDSIPGLVGWEWHGDPAAIAGLEVVAGGPTFAAPGKPNGGNFTATVYPGPKGNFVFNAATILGGRWTQRTTRLSKTIRLYFTAGTRSKGPTNHTEYFGAHADHAGWLASSRFIWPQKGETRACPNGKLIPRFHPLLPKPELIRRENLPQLFHLSLLKGLRPRPWGRVRLGFSGLRRKDREQLILLPGTQVQTSLHFPQQPVGKNLLTVLGFLGNEFSVGRLLLRSDDCGNGCLLRLIDGFLSGFVRRSLAGPPAASHRALRSASAFSMAAAMALS